MSSPPQSRRTVKLGDFELNLDTGELRNNGNKTIIPSQPFQVLLTLLDRPGALVTREELKQQLWTSDTFVDFDQSLNKAVNRLRETLSDSADHPRFIETLPKRGYRFIGPIEPVNGKVSEVRAPAPSNPFDLKTKLVCLPSPTMQSFARSRIIAVAFAAALVALVLYRWTTRPFPVPRLIRTVRITNDGWRKFALLGDGVRLYFSERGRIFQTSAEGGDPTELHIGLANLDLYDLSRTGSELLVTSGVQASETDERSLWTVSLPAGTPRRIGAIQALWAAWAPDGEHIAYATRDAVYLAGKDGTGIRKLGDLPAVPWKLLFSPDGTRLRFDGYDSAHNLYSIWEMSLDRHEITRLFPQWVVPQHTGDWTANSRYFFFNTHDPIKDRDEDVWVLPESGPRNSRTRVQLTSGPLGFGYPVPSADAKHVFVLGTQSWAELQRYDFRQEAFVPYLAGISAWEAEPSRDGQWIAYVSYPDLTLWRSRPDGSDRVQLTFPPVEVISPRWSPDGSQIAFTDLQPGKLWKIYTVSAQGGVPQAILPADTVAEIDPSWWPDGKSILFGRSYWSGKGEILRVDLATHQVWSVPGSEKIFSPRLSPDGTRIAAFFEQGSKLMLYDFRDERWRDLVHGILQFNIWSHDSKSVYMLDVSKEFRIVRLDLAGGGLKEIANLKDVEQGNRGWVGLTLDDTPLVVRDKSVTDVYRLDLQIP
jgi:DNA-binding winged helix-turn-helix (wHTH) protein/Tol biopolymer transport system component